MTDKRRRPNPFCAANEDEALNFFQEEDDGLKFKKHYSKLNFTSICCRSCVDCTRSKGVSSVAFSLYKDDILKNSVHVFI